MKADIAQSIAILARTPPLLDVWLRGLPDDWTNAHEGEGTWSPRDVVGHLIHGDDTDWIPRMRHLLEHGETRPFEPFDRFAQATRFANVPLGDVLDLLRRRRTESLEALRGLRLTAPHLERRGLHPELGAVTLGELLATWVVHDLGHIAQIARVMAKQHAAEVGPWRAYLPVLTR